MRLTGLLLAIPLVINQEEHQLRYPAMNVVLSIDVNLPLRLRTVTMSVSEC